MHKHYVYHFLCQPRRSCQDAGIRTVSSCTASDRQIQLWSDDKFCFYAERQLKRSSASSNAVAPSPIILPTPLSHRHSSSLNLEAISKLQDVVNCNEYISVQTIRKRVAELENWCSSIGEGVTVGEIKKTVSSFIGSLKEDLRYSFSLTREDSKTEALRETLGLLYNNGYTIGHGNIVQRPSMFSPFGASMIDLYLYRDEHFKRYDCAAIVSEVEESNKDDGADNDRVPSHADDNEDDGTRDNEDNADDNGEVDDIGEVNVLSGGVCETKSADYSYYQLYAEMMHFSVQMAVKALMNGILVDQTVLYGVSINYNKQNAKLYKMETSYITNSIVIYGLNNLQPLPIPEVLNYVATVI